MSWKQMLPAILRSLELPEAISIITQQRIIQRTSINPAKYSPTGFFFRYKNKVVSDYIGLLSKKIKGFNNTTINGNLNLSTNTLNITANIPSFNYSNINFTDVNFTGTGTIDTLTLAGNVGDVIINDSLHLPDTKILVKATNDVSDISIKTSASKTLNEADLSLRLQTLPEGFKLNFNPSSFVINDKKWILEKAVSCVLRKCLQQVR